MVIELDIAQGAAALRRGGVIAYPTESVWGLGCDPFDAEAVQRLLQVKQRPADKGLILLAASYEQLAPLLDTDALPRERWLAVLQTWPGPHTWIMPCLPQMPAWLRGAHEGLAVRVSAHPVAAALAGQFGGPIVSTSANRAGAAPPRTRQALDATLIGELDGVVDGETGGLDAPSRIRDALTGDLLRG
ncbi:MAG TPA: Sua5/YciO/YrdC/YwlC family protein [Xanthomonadaceae bacterium]|nr:Sua5/YciO/YrdC/YwlC family protein [Xanthomonadaceae bacterium]